MGRLSTSDGEIGDQSKALMKDSSTACLHQRNAPTEGKVWWHGEYKAIFCPLFLSPSGENNRGLFWATRLPYVTKNTTSTGV